ncbi:MAG: phosphotriesterase [Phycisphaerae bacterium]|jgi:phosphotriesterase-related protein
MISPAITMAGFVHSNYQKPADLFGGFFFIKVTMNNNNLIIISLLLIVCCGAFVNAKQSFGIGHAKKQNIIMTVRGPIKPSSFGKTLPHEHILVDFIGAGKTGPDRYDANEVISIMLPYLLELKDRGFTGFVDCSPAFLARDVKILKQLSGQTGLNILTNTGLYGASNDKYLPEYAFSKTADQLAARWTAEWDSGIEGTGIYPGFIKTAVDPGPLNDTDKKLIRASARTHLKTGLTIACHTGQAQAALEVLEIIRQEGVSPSALIIVHANGIADPNVRIKIAAAGAWVELDGVNENSIAQNVKFIKELMGAGLLNRTLISQDAGWYNVGDEKGGQKIQPFTIIADRLIPALKRAGLTDAQIRQLIVENSAKAYTVKVRI